VEINSGVHLLKRYIRRLPLFPSGDLGLGFGLVILVLVLDLKIWSCFTSVIFWQLEEAVRVIISIRVSVCAVLCLYVYCKTEFDQGLLFR